MLAPPTPRHIALMIAMATDKTVADQFTDNFAYPDRQWSVLASAERTRRYLSDHGLDFDTLLAGAT